MLEHRFRFHGHGSLNFVYRHGRTARCRSLSIRSVINNRRVHARCAVVVAKKVIKAAPKRNRIRRRIYEVLRNNWGHISQAHDIVITVFDAGFVDMSSAELQKQVIECLQTAHLWVDERSGNNPEAV